MTTSVLCFLVQCVFWFILSTALLITPFRFSAFLACMQIHFFSLRKKRIVDTAWQRCVSNIAYLQCDPASQPQDSRCSATLPCRSAQKQNRESSGDRKLMTFAARCWTLPAHVAGWVCLEKWAGRARLQVEAGSAARQRIRQQQGSSASGLLCCLLALSFLVPAFPCTSFCCLSVAC